MTADRSADDSNLTDRFQAYWAAQAADSVLWRTEWSPGRATAWAEAQGIRADALIK